MALGGFQNGAEPVHIGGEGGDNNPLVAVLELPIQRTCHNGLTGGVARPFHIGGICQQSQNALIAQLTEASQINHAVGGGGVNFEVAGHHHRAHRGFDGKGYGVGNGVVHMDELHAEAACLYHIPGLVGHQLDLVCQTVLLQLQLDEAVGHGGAMNGAAELPHGIGNGTNVILVPMGDEHTPQLLAVLHQIAEVGNHQIHAIHIFIGETDTAVHHDHVLAVFQNGDVFSDFIQTAQRDNFQFFCQIKYSFQFFCPKMDKTTKQPLSGKTDPESPHPEKNACISYVRSSGEDRSF